MSYRRIFKSSAIIGSSSAINVLISIVKVKVLAMLLGPTGVGLLGIYQNILNLVTTIFGLGLDGSGVRKLSASSGDDDAVSLLRRTLLLSNVVLGTIGMLLLMLFREPIAMLVFGDVENSTSIGWLGVGMLFSLITVSQLAFLQGLRRISELAKINVLGMLGGAIFGIIAIFAAGQDGLIAFIVVAPISTVIVSFYYTKKILLNKSPCDYKAIYQEWYSLLDLGIPLMVATLVSLATQLAARSIVLDKLGVEAIGHFQAAWSISMTYIGFVLAAMGTDYFPRLSSVINDSSKSRKMVGEQSEVALLLAGPILLWMFALSPLIIEIMYSDSFSPASDILRWQVMGDILKIVGWSMGFVVLASGRGKLFILTQINWNVIYLTTLLVGLDEVGLIMTGISFVIAYMCQAAVVAFVSRKLIGYKISSNNILLVILLFGVCAAGLVIGTKSIVLSYIFNILTAISFTLFSFYRLDQLLDLRGWVHNKLK